MKSIAIKGNSRRDFLKQLGGILGAGASASLLSVASINSALAYNREKNVSEGRLFSSTQLQTLADICQTIIPQTDTPGAADLDCHGFIDHQLMTIYPKDKQNAAIELIDTIDDISQKHLNHKFSKLSVAQQQKCLEQIESGEWADKATINSFKELKYLNAFGYFTSEVGATQVLTYLPVPGGYTPSIPVTAHTKNYGSLAFY